MVKCNYSGLERGQLGGLQGEARGIQGPGGGERTLKNQNS